MAEVEAEKKSSKMMIIIIAVVILLAGGGGAYYFMFMADDSTLEEGAEDVVEEAQEKEPEEEALETGDNELAYFDMKDPFVVNFPKDSGAYLLQISVALLVHGEVSVEVLQKHEPMIRNNFLMLISGQVPTDLKTVEGKEKLQKLMLEEAGETMKKMDGKNKLQNVFFTSFVMQ